MWNYIHNNCIIPSSMNIISIGAPSHTMKYFHIQHLINTKGSLSLNVLNDVFQNQYTMKPSEKCQLSLNSCGKSKRSIFLNSPYGGITTLSEELNMFGNVSIRGKNNITFRIQNNILQITEKEITIRAPLIRIKGHLEVDNQINYIVKKNIIKYDKHEENQRNHDDTKNELCEELNSYTVGKTSQFHTIQSVLEFIELKSPTPNNIILIKLKNDKIYHETINLIRGNIHFMGEQENITFFGSCFINYDSQHKIVFKNIDFNNIDNIFERNKIEINSKSDIRFENCTFNAININFNSLSVYIKNCSFFNVYDMSIFSTNDSYILYSEFYYENDSEDSVMISGNANIWIFCVCVSKKIKTDEKISLKKMINII